MANYARTSSSCVAATHPKQSGQYAVARKLSALSGGHLINDLYVGSLAPLIPIIVARFEISIALAGALASILSVVSSLVQPVLGYVADRSTSKLFVILGPILTAIAMTSLGSMPTVGAIAATLVIAGIGTASFHPQATSMVGGIPQKGRGLTMSIFATAGEVGYSLGPMYIILFINRLGLGRTQFAAIPGLLIAALLYRSVANNRQGESKPWGTDDPGKTGNAGNLGGSPRRQEGLKVQVRPFLLVWLVAVFRTLVIVSFATFLPTLFEQKGMSLTLGSAASASLGLAGSAGMLVVGYMMDRLNATSTIKSPAVTTIRVMMLSLILPAPLLLGFLSSSGVTAYICLVLGGMALYSSTPVTTLMAQDLIPGGASMASGLMMGLAWGVGSLGLIPVGWLADMYGMTAALAASLVVLVLAIAALAMLNAHTRRAVKSQG